MVLVLQHHSAYSSIYTLEKLVNPQIHDGFAEPFLDPIKVMINFQKLDRFESFTLKSMAGSLR
jgi:hypothetical protein